MARLPSGRETGVVIPNPLHAIVSCTPQCAVVFGRKGLLCLDLVYLTAIVFVVDASPNFIRYENLKSARLPRGCLSGGIGVGVPVPHKLHRGLLRVSTQSNPHI